MASTPAPTLEELPPQKGSILELHSINDDFNGKLVEFLKEDKEYMGGSDKIYVRLLENEEQSLRVKKICCRRPDIKPRKLRLLLARLSRKFCDDCPKLDSSYSDWERDEARIKSFLEKDPCCAFAHEALGWIALHGDESFKESGMTSEEVADVVVRYLRRALGSWYAYRDTLTDPEGYEQHMETRIAEFLTRAGHNKSAIRMHPRVLNSSNLNRDKNMLLHTEYYAGTALMHTGDKLNDHEQFSRQCNKYTEAVSHFLTAVGLGTSMEKNGSISQKTVEFVVCSIKDIHIIFEFFSDRESKNNAEHTDLKKRMLKIADDVLKACTDNSGSVHFLSDDNEYPFASKDFWLEQLAALRLELAENEVEE